MSCALHGSFGGAAQLAVIAAAAGGARGVLPGDKAVEGGRRADLRRAIAARTSTRVDDLRARSDSAPDKTERASR
ncbi:MAG: hypothetical protein D6725_12010 [Planctomycetota bacterium]|nr:MAG: hypothetical protein D6725_12010 [Planctomycetota bacterium]